jgi:hypothetical protein
MMKKLFAASAVLALFAGALHAQEDVTSKLPEGAMKPTNLSDLGSQMKDRVSEIVSGDVEEAIEGDGVDDGLSLFAGQDDEDDNILEIKRIARELDSQRALMKQISELQRDLIDFAMADPAAAHKSRIPASVCEYALEERFCDAMTASFRTSKK